MRESDLCDQFAGVATGYGWTIYAETGWWDLLLVDGAGTQIGVQAKLRANLKVIMQALPGLYDRLPCGPHFRAILTADGMDLASLCRPLRLLRFGVCGSIAGKPVVRHSDYLDTPAAREPYRWPTERPVELPPVVPRHSGGCPSPLVLSRWKIGALRVLARCEARGYVTTADGTELGHDMGYLIRTNMLVKQHRVGRFWRYVIGIDKPHRPDKQHPAEYAELLAVERAKAALQAAPADQEEA